MPLKTIRKALIATAGTALSAYVAAWAQTNGVLPGWPTAGSCVLLGVVAGLAVFGVRNADKPIPASAAHLAPPTRIRAAAPRHGAQ